MTMQSFVRNALIGAALLGAPGLVTSTLPASACDCTNCRAEHCLPPPHPNDDPSAGSVGFKKSKKKHQTIKHGSSLSLSWYFGTKAD